MPNNVTDDLNTSTFNLKPLLSPLTLFSTTFPDDTLEHVLTKVESSHEPILVFDKEDEFQGILSIGENLFRKRTPYSTKVKHVMFMPPKLTESTNLFEVVKAMLATQIYGLPVFSNQKVIGLIEAVKLIQWLWNSDHNINVIATTIRLRPPATISHTASIQETLALFRKSNRSRLLVVNDKDAVVGLINRSDLKSTYYTPPTRDRFTSTSNPRSKAVKDTNELYRGDAPLSRFYKPIQSEALHTWRMKKIIDTLIKSDFNYIVVMDQTRKPAGMISTRNLLEAMAHYA